MHFKNGQQCDDLISTGDISIDEACLNIINYDADDIIEFWAQSEECYNCSSWRYVSLNPGSSSILKVNSTYPTDIILEASQRKCLFKYKYHFVQHGVYSLAFNSSYFPSIVTEHQGNNEYTAILVAILFFFFMYIFVWAAKALHRKMGEGRLTLYRNRNVIDTSSSNLLPEEGTSREPETEFQFTGNDSTNVSTSKRLRSLDTFRGLSIAIMIFVNYKGGKYYFFNHSPWNGLTVADLVFPWFMWIMGVSLTFSIQSQSRSNSSFCSVFLKILKRSIILFALGIIINSMRSNLLPMLRIFGVLQRFSLCYFVNASLEALSIRAEPIVEVEFAERSRWWWLQDLLRSWTQWMVISMLVICHTVLTFALPIKGCPTGYLGPGGIHLEGRFPNCTGGSSGYIDRFLLGPNHLHQHPTCKNIYDSSVPFDPEGILGVLTSCLTVQFGVAAGRIILYFPNHSQRVLRWLIWGVFLGIIGGFLCGWSREFGIIPVNKNLWSLSFAFVTASFAFILLSFLYFVTDVKEKWTGSVFRIAGMNSILLYIGHELTQKLFPWSWKSNHASHSGILFMSIWATCLWLIIAVYCHKKKFYLSL